MLTITLSANHLIVRYFEAPTDKIKTSSDAIRLVILSDLHNHEFGKHNERLVKKVRKQSPDLIFLVGDMLNEDSDNTDVVCNLIESLSDIAPIYFALGNHEGAYMQARDTDLIQKLETAGATVLEENYVDLDVNCTALRLGGMYDYAFGNDLKSGENVGAEIPDAEGAFLREFQDTDRLKIMMSHRPDSFIFGDASSYWDIDLVVSGHNHGGQVVVPFLGGIYGGDQGWFPEYIHGMYRKDEMQIFITSGLGSDRKMLPRMNNLPEIAVVTLKAE